ncbi:MAG: hypothetical protein B7Y93_01855 [Micrococcales bacterium 32-70-13]|nr:MAG: hypothetical protein B7Y93_01855 [Micrococcales bacterium 32-70-13]
MSATVSTRRRGDVQRGSSLMSALLAGARLAALSLLVSAASPALAQAPAAPAGPTAGPSVTVTRAEISEIVQSVVVSGSMIARDEVLVQPEVDGLSIVALLAEEGDRVSTGQVLARLSRTTLEVQQTQNEAQIARAEAAIAQANAQIGEAQANLVAADNNFERTQTLRNSGNVSNETFDLRSAAARAARARLNAANQALAIATADLALAKAQGRDIEVKLGRTEIKAPQGGILSAREGASVSESDAELLLRYDPPITSGRCGSINMAVPSSAAPPRCPPPSRCSGSSPMARSNSRRRSPRSNCRG